MKENQPTNEERTGEDKGEGRFDALPGSKKKPEKTLFWGGNELEPRFLISLRENKRGRPGWSEEKGSRSGNNFGEN